MVSGSHFSNNISFSRFGLLKYLYRPEITITMANYAKQEKLRPENWHYTTLIKFAVVFDTFTEAWKSKVKLMKTAILYLLITIWISFPVKSEDKREHFRSICRFIHRLFHFKTDFLQFEASGEKNDKSGKNSNHFVMEYSSRWQIFVPSRTTQPILSNLSSSFGDHTTNFP